MILKVKFALLTKSGKKEAHKALNCEAAATTTQKPE